MDRQKTMLSEPINSTNKVEQQIDGPYIDWFSILQGERFCLKGELTEKESTSPEPIVMLLIIKV